MKVRDIIRLLETNDLHLGGQKGSHRRFTGVVGGQKRMVIVAGADGDDVPKGTLAAIRRQSGLPRDLFR